MSVASPSRGEPSGTGLPLRRLRQASAASYVAFGSNGFLFASWASRIPAVRDDLTLSTGTIGLVLLALSGGAVIALPMAGVVVRRLGPATTVLVTGLLASVAVAGVGLAPTIGVLAGSLFLVGVASGTWDVAMNVEAAAVERSLDTTIMPRYHGAFSLGTVVGAAVGAAAAGAGVGRDSHLVAVGVVTAVAVVAATTRFLPRAATSDGHGTEAGQGAPVTPTGPSGSFGVLDAWREPRTLLVGLMVLGFSLVEGIANDWLALAVVDTLGVENWLGAAVFGVFVTGMTVGRLLGAQVVDVLGPRRVVLVSGVLAAAGAVIVSLVPSVSAVVVGALLWGLGASLGFPVGMTAVAGGRSDAERAALRVSVVASIGYTAFLAGPPLVGFLGERIGLDGALLVVPVAAALAVLCGRAVPAERRRPGRGEAA